MQQLDILSVRDQKKLVKLYRNNVENCAKVGYTGGSINGQFGIMLFLKISRVQSLAMLSTFVFELRRYGYSDTENSSFNR